MNGLEDGVRATFDGKSTQVLQNWYGRAQACIAHRFTVACEAYYRAILLN